MLHLSGAGKIVGKCSIQQADLVVRKFGRYILRGFKGVKKICKGLFYMDRFYIQNKSLSMQVRKGPAAFCMQLVYTLQPFIK